MDVVVRDLDGLAELTAASRLYRTVFGYDQPEYAVSPRLLAALRENSGSVIGALDGAGTMIGFCYGFSAVDAGELYHYSQATVVAAGAQGLGVGRRLKQAQAETARGTGARPRNSAAIIAGSRRSSSGSASCSAWPMSRLPSCWMKTARAAW